MRSDRSQLASFDIKSYKTEMRTSQQCNDFQATNDAGNVLRRRYSVYRSHGFDGVGEDGGFRTGYYSNEDK
ncbi:hypothetical protein V6N13_068654 [Hibiscus sabdariffa]